MRIISTVTVFILCVSLLGCGKGKQVNGRSLKSANRSVAKIVNRMPADSVERIEFEVSYWTLRDSIRDRDEFLSTVGGKNQQEVIVLGKEVFQARKNSGFRNYDKYNNWDHMITTFVQERIDQGKHKTTDSRKNASVTYKL